MKTLCIYAEVELTDKQEFDDEVKDLCELICDSGYYKKGFIQIDSRDNNNHKYSHFFKSGDEKVNKNIAMYNDSPAVKGHEATRKFEVFSSPPKLFFKVVGEGEALINRLTNPSSKKAIAKNIHLHEAYHLTNKQGTRYFSWNELSHRYVSFFVSKKEQHKRKRLTVDEQIAEMGLAL